MGIIKEQIAKKLLYYRKKFNYTQTQLGEMLGVKNTSVSNWENGENSIDIETLVKACEIFGITLNDIYENAKEQIKISHHEEKIILAYRMKPEMHDAIDTLLGLKNKIQTTNIKCAARNGIPGEHEIPKEKAEEAKNFPDVTDDI